MLEIRRHQTGQNEGQIRVFTADLPFFVIFTAAPDCPCLPLHFPFCMRIWKARLGHICLFFGGTGGEGILWLYPVPSQSYGAVQSKFRTIPALQFLLGPSTAPSLYVLSVYWQRRDAVFSLDKLLSQKCDSRSLGCCCHLIPVI